MVFFFFNGRLGNQAFQISTLRSLFSSHKIVTFNFDDYIKVFKCERLVNISSRFLPRGIFTTLQRLLQYLSYLRVISSLKEQRNSQSDYKLSYRHGLLRSFIYVFPSDFQHSSNQPYFHSPTLLPSLRSQALSWFSRHEINLNLPLLFIHIRRGDYLSWPSPNHPAYLDMSWYETNYFRLLSKYPSINTLVFSDDPLYVSDNLRIKNYVLVQESLPLEFALMTYCSVGILSPSSLSWWASFIASSNMTNTLFIAPFYWAGHRQQQWYPSSPFSDHLTFVID